MGRLSLFVQKLFGVLVLVGVGDRRDDGDEAYYPGNPQKCEFPVALAGNGFLHETENGKNRTEKAAIEQELFHDDTSATHDTPANSALAPEGFVG